LAQDFEMAAMRFEFLAVNARLWFALIAAELSSAKPTATARAKMDSPVSFMVLSV